MKRPVPLLCLILACWIPVSLQGQVDVRLSASQDQFLPAEPLEVAVKISNFTGAPLTLGTHAGWIAFTVERSDGGVVNKRSDPGDSGEFTLQQATAGTIRFDLAPMFALQQPGTYRVTATITPVVGRETFVSLPLALEIIHGVRLNEDRPFGFLKPDGTLEQRQYLLQQANFLKRVSLYLRVTDANESQTLKVLPLGPLVSFDRPKWVMDRKSHLHVLHQFGPDDFRYHEVDPDGVLITRQTWRISNRRPELRVNESGQIAVIGGVRRPDRSDVPPTPAPEPSAAAKTPPATNAVEVVPPPKKKNASTAAKTR